MRKVSIIIPVWARTSYIGRIIDFLSKQTYGNFETIFVVDSRTAESIVPELERHADKLPNMVTVVRDFGERLGAGRNIGLEEATGEIIWFLDADDRPLPDFLSDMVEVMEREDADIVLCNHIRSSGLYPSLPRKGTYNVLSMNREEAVKARFKERIPVTAWSKIINKELIERIGLRFNHGYSEDVEHTFHALSGSCRVCYYEKPLYVYYQHSDSICGNRKIDDARGTAEIETYDRLEEHFKDDETIGKMFSRYSSLLRMRSAAHMSRSKFLEYARSKGCRDMIDRNLRDPVSPEAVFFRLFPSLYYSLVKVYLDLVFYRDGRCYTGRKIKR